MIISYTLPEIWHVTDVIIFHFRLFFCPFTPVTDWKTKISKKWKKCLEISSFYTSVPKIMILCHTVPEIWRVTDLICIFHFKLFFALLSPAPSPPNSPKNQNFIKMKKTKKQLEISSFYTCEPKIMIIWCTVPEIWCPKDGWTDRWTDGQIDKGVAKVTYRGGCPT